MSTTHFTGLGMPVFTAFGWAGEEAALKFAFSQLDLFINELHASLPRSIQVEFPFFGVSRENQGVYLAVNGDVESDAHVAFYARPLSMEIQLAIADKSVLSKALINAEKDPLKAHHLITQIGPEWALRVQQMQIDEESGEVSHYQDLFKDSVSQFQEETAVATFSKAVYLNAQDQWITPIYLSRRFSSEQAAAMGQAIVRVIGEQINLLMPIFFFLTGQAGKKPGKSARKTKAKPVAVVEAMPEVKVRPEDEFTYVTELKPLHIRRGFVNLTPQHWPFFALTARTETRDVSVYYAGLYDKKCSVWRLQPNDQARLVLGPSSHEWLEDNFMPEDKIQIKARKLSEDEIQISISSIEE